MSDPTNASSSHTHREQRLQQQYDEIAGLAGGLAHEIRNPISTIRMNLELMLEDVEQSDDPHVHRLTRKLTTIQQECEHLDDILEAFLKFARAGELYLQEVDFGEEIRSFLDFYQTKAQQENIELRPHLPTDLPRINLDKRLMRQVLVNLVQNAQQAMPDGGVLELQASQNNEDVILHIIDTGEGMNQTALSNMFQIFFSTKPTGSGLGLPTARKIVEAHGGTIICESEVGRGTKFTITLPITQG